MGFFLLLLFACLFILIVIYLKMAKCFLKRCCSWLVELWSRRRAATRLPVPVTRSVGKPGGPVIAANQTDLVSSPSLLSQVTDGYFFICYERMFIPTPEHDCTTVTKLLKTLLFYSIVLI